MKIYYAILVENDAGEFEIKYNGRSYLKSQFHWFKTNRLRFRIKGPKTYVDRVVGKKDFASLAALLEVK